MPVPVPLGVGWQRGTAPGPLLGPAVPVWMFWWASHSFKQFSKNFFYILVNDYVVSGVLPKVRVVSGLGREGKGFRKTDAPFLKTKIKFFFDLLHSPRSRRSGKPTGFAPLEFARSCARVSVPGVSLKAKGTRCKEATCLGFTASQNHYAGF